MRCGLGWASSLSDSDRQQIEDVSLDLIPVALIRQRLRVIVLVTLVIATGVAALVSLLATALLGVGLGLILAIPACAVVIKTWRRRISLRGKVVRCQRFFGTSTVDLASPSNIDIVVRSATLSQVSLRVRANGATVTIPLAFYGGAGGRELEILPLRKLADGLTAGDSAAGAAVASVLIDQLRSEARGCGLDERPLYRAAMMGSLGNSFSERALTDEEVASLIE